MDKVCNYQIDTDAIEETFKFNKGFTHKQGVKYKLLPFVANEKTLVSEFSGVVGAFSRMISNKEIKGEFEVESFIEEVAEQVAEFEGESSELSFKKIIKTMFIYDDNLVNFDIKTFNYISSTSSEQKVASFLYSVLYDKSLSEDVGKSYDREVENILYKLVLRALPELKDKEFHTGEYKCYLPYVRDLFLKDFKFLLSNEELYKNSLKRLLEYYYMFYISQLTMKLEQFEKADLTVADKLYYTLDWEKTSKSRTAYQFGWEKIKNSAGSLFSHAVVLEMLNHNEIDEQLGYKDLARIIENMDEDEINKINELTESYMNQLKDIRWQNFKYDGKKNEIEGFDYIYRLFNAVKYQFENSARNRANESYKNWFVRFVQSNFSKRRGQLGYNLNFTENDVILMTKICINNEEKIKLNNLFEEFELRGIFFDRDSKTKIVQLYEKLNLLEKKSDSGDAQYVKSI